MKAPPIKLTDRSLPPGLSAVSPDAGLFDDLLEMEKLLDWTMTRRRQEIFDTLNRGMMQVSRLNSPVKCLYFRQTNVL
jgi:hypothetical protein